MRLIQKRQTYIFEALMYKLWCLLESQPVIQTGISAPDSLLPPPVSLTGSH